CPPVPWPPGEGGHGRDGGRLLGPPHIARVRGKIGDQSTIGLAGAALDRAVGHRLSTRIHAVTLRFNSGASGRTSTAPSDAAGQRAAHSSAASSEGSSRMVYPPSCSLVSA